MKQIKIIQKDTTKDLEEIINKYLADGWGLYGSIFVVESKTIDMYDGSHIFEHLLGQVLIKEEVI